MQRFVLSQVFFGDITRRPRQYVICPICQSYCAGTLERYECKTQISRLITAVIWYAAYQSNSIEEALIEIDESPLTHCRILQLQAKDRLTKQPKCFEIFKNYQCMNINNFT